MLFRKGKMTNENPDEKPAKPAKPASGGDAGVSQVQEKMDEATEKGFIGESPDETPRENYTVKGVTSGAETPENPKE
jgi:hypothetical protein